MRNSPVSRDELDVLRVELDEIKRRLLRRENDHSPTVPVYLPDVPDDQIDGQFALVPADEVLVQGEDVKPSWSWDDVWRSFTPSCYGRIARDGGAGTLAITSGATNSTTTLIDHNLVSDEVGIDCDIVSSPTRITILTSGLYAVSGALSDPSAGAGDYGFVLSIGINTTSPTISGLETYRRILNDTGAFRFTYFAHFDAGDYITQVVGQNSGTTKTFTYLAQLFVARISD